MVHEVTTSHVGAPVSRRFIAIIPGKMNGMISVKRLSKIWVTTITRSVEKILAATKMLQPPTTLVPKFEGIQQLSNHVCHDVGISYSFASYQGFSPIFSLKTAHFR